MKELVAESIQTGKMEEKDMEFLENLQELLLIGAEEHFPVILN